MGRCVFGQAQHTMVDSIGTGMKAAGGYGLVGSRMDVATRGGRESKPRNRRRLELHLSVLGTELMVEWRASVVRRIKDGGWWIGIRCLSCTLDGLGWWMLDVGVGVWSLEASDTSGGRGSGWGTGVLHHTGDK